MSPAIIKTSAGILYNFERQGHGKDGLSLFWRQGNEFLMLVMRRSRVAVCGTPRA